MFHGLASPGSNLEVHRWDTDGTQMGNYGKSYDNVFIWEMIGNIWKSLDNSHEHMVFGNLALGDIQFQTSYNQKQQGYLVANLNKPWSHMSLNGDFTL